MKTQTTHHAETKYGFEWGAAKIERAASHNGHVILYITTPRERIHVRVTPTGLIRVEGPMTNKGESHCVSV